MRVQMKFYDYEIHPGTYTLNTSMSSKRCFRFWMRRSKKGGHGIMMDQDRITQYIHSLDQGHGAFCDQIAKTARTGRVPIIRKETANFLQAMVAAKQPKRILEVGTAGLFCPSDGAGHAGGNGYHHH